MSDGDQRVEPAAWPPPHPSPPHPPLRGSGVPGAPPSRAPYVAGALAVLVVVGLVLLLVVVLTGDDEPRDRSAGSDPSTSAPASGSASGSASASASPSDSPGPASAATCWDGTTAEEVEECSTPTGAAGLAWIFPAMAGDKCGATSSDAGDGVATRVLCLHRFSDGTRAQVGYFEWDTVEQGAAFYDAQGLERSTSADYVAWLGGAGGQAKTVAMYASAPFSVSITYPSSASPDSGELFLLVPRPPGELKGLPGG